MSISNEARGKITEAVNVLTDRFGKTTDSGERAKITEAINDLNDARAVLNQAQLLDAADTVIDATVSLERVVRSARLGPFDDYVRAIEGVINRVSEMMRNGELTEHLHRAKLDTTTTPQPQAPVDIKPSNPPPVSKPNAPASSGSAPTTAPKPPSATPPAQTPGSTTIELSTGTDFGVLHAEYEQAFNATAVREQYKEKVDWHIKQLLKYESRYRAVSPQLNNVPWALVGVIHAMECGFNFACHLHNGDPLTSRTSHVPAGCPKTGDPPYGWEASAVDALKLEGFGDVTDWSMARMLYSLEKYNGFGYRPKKIPTPYLWSFSNLYDKGKYVADGRFDPTAVSQQCGAGVMLKSLVNQGVSLV